MSVTATTTQIAVPASRSTQSHKQVATVEEHSHQVSLTNHKGASAVLSGIQGSQASKKADWHQFDEDVEQILEGTAKGDVDRRLETMATIIVSIAVERFGTKEVNQAPAIYTPNHTAKKIQHLRKELKALKRQYKKAGDVEKGGLLDLRAILKKELLTTEVLYHKRARVP